MFKWCVGIFVVCVVVAVAGVALLPSLVGAAAFAAKVAIGAGCVGGVISGIGAVYSHNTEVSEFENKLHAANTTNEAAAAEIAELLAMKKNIELQIAESESTLAMIKKLRSEEKAKTDMVLNQNASLIRQVHHSSTQNSLDDMKDSNVSRLVYQCEQVEDHGNSAKIPPQRLIRRLK